jgi:hypothetical protein
MHHIVRKSVTHGQARWLRMRVSFFLTGIWINVWRPVLLVLVPTPTYLKKLHVCVYLRNIYSKSCQLLKYYILWLKWDSTCCSGSECNSLAMRIMDVDASMMTRKACKLGVDCKVTLMSRSIAVFLVRPHATSAPFVFTHEVCNKCVFSCLLRLRK